MENYTCCFCGGKFNDWGNNPWPANNDADAKCCDTCNMEIVFPARLAKMRAPSND